MPLETFLDAVRGLRECFVFEPGEAWALPRWVCPKADLADFRERSPLHRRLVETALEHVGGP